MHECILCMLCLQAVFFPRSIYLFAPTTTSSLRPSCIPRVHHPLCNLSSFSWPLPIKHAARSKAKPLLTACCKTKVTCFVRLIRKFRFRKKIKRIFLSFFPLWISVRKKCPARSCIAKKVARIFLLSSLAFGLIGLALKNDFFLFNLCLFYGPTNLYFSSETVSTSASK